MTISFLISTFLIIRKEEQDFVSREAEGKLIALSGDIEKSFEGYTELSVLVMMEDSFQYFLRADQSDVDAGIINDAKRDIQTILSVTTGVDCVYVFRKDGTYVCTKGSLFEIVDPNYTEENWSRVVLDQRGKPIEYINGSGALRRINDQPFISIERAVYDMNNQHLSGYMMMLISGNVVEHSVMNSGNANTCVMGLNGSYIAGNSDLLELYSPKLSGHEVTQYITRLNGENVVVSGMRVGNKPMMMISVTPIRGVFFPEQTAMILLFLLAMIVFCFIMVGRFTYRNITHPINKLANSMEVGDDRDGLSTIDFPLPDNELGKLKDSYNSMIRKIRELFDELLAKEQSVQRAEMRVLQEQIKPHFLYNTIGTISALALESGSEEVSSALETMGRFYRNFLSKGDREITLEKEVTIVRDYLALQKLRYGEILQDEYSISQGVENCIVPKLILQPLVENSIYHGIRQKGEPGVIKISAFIEDEDLHISVYDNGVGMDKEAIAKLAKGGKNISGEENSFGLWGTIERVRYFSHRNNVVRIESEEGEFTRIELVMPVVRSSEGSGNV